MRKQSLLFVLLIAVTSAISAAGTGNNNSDKATLQTKQLLKFSAQEFTGTEDVAAGAPEALPADMRAAQENMSADSTAYPAGHPAGEKQPAN